MTEKSDPLDVAQLAKRDLTETAFPTGKQNFRVFFDSSIHERIAAHAAEKLTVEICGVLVGQWHRDAGGPFVLVNEAIRCDKAVSNAGDVTLTHQDWNDVNREMDTKFIDRAIVGWYHSHPNFGIFLSDRDMFIQEYTFNGPGQIAYVVDPVNGVEGVFSWRKGKAKLLQHFWVGDEIHLSSKGAERKPSSADPAGQSPAPAPRSEAVPPLSATMTWILCAVCFLLLGYLMGSWFTAADRILTTRAAVTHYGVFKGLKLGMRENMDKVSNVMKGTSQNVVNLANEHIASLTGDAQEEKRKQWSEVAQNLKDVLNALALINDFYSLSPDEAAEVQRLMIEAENAKSQAAKDSAARDSGQKATAAKTSGTQATATPTSAAPTPATSATAAKTTSEPAKTTAAIAPAPAPSASPAPTPVSSAPAPLAPTPPAPPAATNQKP